MARLNKRTLEWLVPAARAGNMDCGGPLPVGLPGGGPGLDPAFVLLKGTDILGVPGLDELGEVVPLNDLDDPLADVVLVLGAFPPLRAARILVLGEALQVGQLADEQPLVVAGLVQAVPLQAEERRQAHPNVQVLGAGGRGGVVILPQPLLPQLGVRASHAYPRHLHFILIIHLAEPELPIRVYFSRNR